MIPAYPPSPPPIPPHPPALTSLRIHCGVIFTATRGRQATVISLYNECLEPVTNVFNLDIRIIVKYIKDNLGLPSEAQDGVQLSGNFKRNLSNHFL